MRVLTADGMSVLDNQQSRLRGLLRFFSRDLPPLDLDPRVTILAMGCEAKMRSIVGSPIADPMTVL